MSVIIQVDELVRGKNVVIEDGVSIRGGTVVLGDNVTIKRGTSIEATERLLVGKNSIIGEHNVIAGRDISLGREFFSNHHAEIGGGSCLEKTSKLEIGYWFHLGSYAIINTAMPVKIGNECGFGRFSNIFTHGAYQSILDGYPVDFAPVTVGSNVWAPSATINSGVTIGDCVVIAAGSIVKKNLPSCCVAAGNPAKILMENLYPRKLKPETQSRAIDRINELFDLKMTRQREGVYTVDNAEFDMTERRISGKASPASERCRNVLRRWGIRFRYEVADGEYVSWDDAHIPEPLIMVTGQVH